MALVVNGANGGTNGATVTQGAGGNSGGVSGNFFDTLVIGDATATLVFDNAHAAHGGLSYKFQLGSVATEDYVQWLASFSPVDVTPVWLRAYCKFTANPGATIYVARVAQAAGTSVAGIALDTAGKLLAKDGAGTIQATSAAAIPLNQWFRWEAQIVGSATVGQITIRRFDTADAVQPSEILATAATLNTAGAMSRIRFGHTGTGVATVGPWWMDDLGASTVDYMGPVGAGYRPPPIFAPLKRPVRLRFVKPAQGVAEAPPAGNAPAEVADAAAVGEQPTIEIDTGAENASATAASNQPTVKVSPGAGVANAAASANNPTIRVDTGPTSAAATGVANQPSPAIRVNPGVANAAAAALDATVSVTGGTNAPAGVANATAVGEQSTVRIATGPTSAAAAAAGLQPAPSVKPGAGNAAATAAGLQPTPDVKTGPGVANTAAAALNPTVSVTGGTNAQAQVANATATANQPGPAVRATAALASAAAIVNAAAARIGPTPAMANANAQARDPGGRVLVGAGVASTAGTAWNAATQLPSIFTHLSSRGMGPRYTTRNPGGRTSSGVGASLTARPKPDLTAKPSPDRYDVE